MMKVLAIVIGILGGTLIFFAVKYQKQLKKAEKLTEQMEQFLHDPDQILAETLMEGVWANLYNQVSRLEKQVCYEQKNAEKIEKGASEFVENMAHQIMNAVTALQLQLYLAQETTDENQKHLRKSQVYAERVQREVDRILKSGQLSNGKIHMMYEPVYIRKELEYCAEQLRSVAREKHVSILLEAEEELLYFGDAFWISQALENLMKNAVEHTAEESCVSVSAISEKRKCIIRVEDCGEGIPQEQLGTLFLRFHRGERTKAGYGVGLSMTKDIVEAHHGKIIAGNRAGRGAWFEIELPFLDGARSYKV